MKLTKENVYINLQGKTKEELTDLWEFLTSNEEKPKRTLNYFLEYEYAKGVSQRLGLDDCDQWSNDISNNKIEVTIQQLKEILQPMGTFTPIAMKCTQEQFETIKPKLKGCMILGFKNFKDYGYIINNHNGENKIISNANESQKNNFGRTVHEEWNEEIFLKACGIEVDSLEQQLQKAEAEVKRLQSLIEEENKPKINDWVYNKEEDIIYQKYYNMFNKYENKITNTELIKLLEQEIK